MNLKVVDEFEETKTLWTTVHYRIQRFENILNNRMLINRFNVGWNLTTDTHMFTSSTHRDTQCV